MKDSLHALMEANHNNNACVICDGTGNNIYKINTCCDECLGTGFNTILGRKDADIALKEMLSTIDSSFMRDIQLKAVKQAFELVPSSEIIYENEEDEIMIVKLFEDIFIAFDSNGVKWVQY